MDSQTRKKQETIQLWKDLAHIYSHRERLGSEATRKTYKRIANEWLGIVANEESGDVVHPADLDAMHISKFITKPVQRKLSKIREKRVPGNTANPASITNASPSYMQLRMSVLVGLLDEAVLRNICDRNIARDYQRTHAPKRQEKKLRRHALTREQWQEFIAQIRARTRNEHLLSRNLALFYLLLYSGLRVHELVGMRLGDINWKRHEIDIIGKGGKDKPVILSPVAEPYLRDWIENHRASILKGRESDFVWISSLGRQMSVAQVQKLCRETMAAAGISKQMSGPHVFRHTFVTWAIDSGADINDVAVAARHSNIGTTQKYHSASEDAMRWRIMNILK